MSRINAIHSITLRKVQDKFAPPDEPCLNVSVVGDMAFLNIIKVEETSDTETHTTQTSIDVDANALLDALYILVRDGIRSNQKEPV